MSMSTRVMDHSHVTDFNFRQLSVDRKLVVVFTKRTNKINDLSRGGVFFTQNRNVMISAVHARTH